MKLRRLLAVLISVMLMLGLVACNEGDVDTIADAIRDGLGGVTGGGTDGTADGGDGRADPISGRYDLVVPYDVLLGRGTLANWVSDGFDEIFNGKDPEKFQNASFLVIECSGTINPDARAGFAWMSSAYQWDWIEDQDGFNLANYIYGSRIILPLSQVVPRHTDYKFGDLGEENVIKIYFRYGNERGDVDDVIEDLGITAVYLATGVNIDALEGNK